MEKLSIIIPAHNEEKRIGRTLKSYLDYFKNKNLEIVVVVNNCNDDTLKIVKNFKADFTDKFNVKEKEFEIGIKKI